MLIFGVVADPHFSKEKQIYNRFPSLSKEKMKAAVEEWKRQKVSFVVCLGDLINSVDNLEEDAQHAREISRILRTAEVPVFCTMGNHDIEGLSREQFTAMTGFQAPPFSLSVSGYKLIFLDANYGQDGSDYEQRMDWTDSAVPLSQCLWLQKELQDSSEPALIFVHQNLDSRLKEGKEDPHVIKNADEVRKILESSGKVKAVFQGHFHKGYKQELSGIPYITVPAMCEGNGEGQNAFGIVEISENQLIYREYCSKIEEYRNIW